MTYEELIDKLESVDVSKCFPIYIPSVLRPNHYLYKNVIQYLPKNYIKEKVFYITRQEYYEEYKEAQPDVNIIVIPKEYEYPGYGLDTTRKFVFDLAAKNKHHYIFDWDDDISCLTAIYSAGENSRRLRKEDRQKYAMQLLTLASEVSTEAFNKYPKLCLGRINRITPSSCTKDFHKDKIWINIGGIPRGANILNISRMKKHDMERTGEYDMHCEDIGISFTVLEKGGWLFTIPTIAFSLPSIEPNLRTEVILHGDEASLWETAEKQLLNHPVGKYLTYTSANIKYFHRKRPIGVNWHRWNKDHNIQSIKENW